MLAVEHFVGGFGRVSCGRHEKLESALELREEFVEMPEGEIRRKSSEGRNDMVLDGLNGTFSFVAAVSMGRDMLDSEGKGAKSAFEGGRSFGVSANPDWVETGEAKFADSLMISTSVFDTVTGLKANDLDNVLIDEDKEIVDAGSSGEWEAAGGITMGS